MEMLMRSIGIKFVTNRKRREEAFLGEGKWLAFDTPFDLVTFILWKVQCAANKWHEIKEPK